MLRPLKTKPKGNKAWMKGFSLIDTKRDDLDLSQAEAACQIIESTRKRRKHYLTK